MARVAVNKYDTPEHLLKNIAVIEADIPKAKKGEVVIHMRFRSINPADFFFMTGYYRDYVGDPPVYPGAEGMGIITALGEGVDSTRLAVGDRVVPLALFTMGTYSEYVAIDSELVVRVPEGVSDEHAAQLVVNPLTVMAMLQVAAPPPGSYILQAAGGSALGKQLIQLAKSRGVKTISTVRRCEQVEELKRFGADEVICTSTTPDIAKRVLEITKGTGAWAAFDPVAGNMTGILSAGVRAGGHVFIFGALSGQTFQGSIPSTLFRGVSISGFSIGAELMKVPSKQKRDFMTEGLNLMKNGIITPHTGSQFDLHQIKAAIAEVQKPASASQGKVLLVTPATCMRTEL